ncbi:neutral zinc metallopeptidase [Acidobacteriota bacterium]
MRWRGRRQSTHVDDRRRMGGGRKMAFGGGIGGIVLIALFMLLGGDPQELMDQQSGLLDPAQSVETTGPLPDDEMAQFVSVVLADTEDVWKQIFSASGLTYREPTLVLFRGQVQSACGFSSAATGPFYCPGDEKIYIDLLFLEDMQRKFQTPGDFAVAYILAHEVGHHVQQLLGIMDRIQDRSGWQRGRLDSQQLVRLELQADFLAGVWAHHAQRMSNILEEGDIDEALNAAQAVGDDRIQKRTQGYIVPDSFTHGTSEQRLHWLLKGIRTGDPNQGDTFSADIR